MAKRPVFDFGLGQAPRVRDKQDWLQVAEDTRALGSAALENARLLALDHVEPGPWQVRQSFRPDKMAELVESIRTQGVLEPILVRAAQDGRYHIIAGERRCRAAREAGLNTIPALVLEVDDVRARVVSLMENIQRDDLNEVERAEGFVALKEITAQTWDEVGHMLGITKRHVLHLVSLTRLPESVQELVRNGRLSAKHGRLLAYVKDPQVQIGLADLIAELRLNAQQTAEAVTRVGGEPGFTASGETRQADQPSAQLRDRLFELIAPLVEPQPPVPAPDVPQVAVGDVRQLAEAIGEVRRAVVAFPHGPVEDDAARRLHAELSAMIQAAQALLARVPLPPPAD